MQVAPVCWPLRNVVARGQECSSTSARYRQYRFSRWCVAHIATLLERGYALHIHAALLCRASCRAREKCAAKNLKKKGAPEPRPLRASGCPHGLPNLTYAVVFPSQIIFAKHCAELVHFARSCVIAIENPKRGYICGKDVGLRSGVYFLSTTTTISACLVAAVNNLYRNSLWSASAKLWYRSRAHFPSGRLLN